MSNSKNDIRIGVYVGQGASHSWTWFADILEREGFYNLCFLDEDQVRKGALAGLEALLVAGGDTYGLAEGLGEDGSQELAGFIARGGYYLGSCAGAYLMLNSSKEELNLFNYVKVKVKNHVKECPSMKNEGDKPFWRYRCRDIFHPVRDEVAVKFNGGGPLSRDQEVVAPLFGGPIMIPSAEAVTLASYSNFTGKTMFLLQEDRAKEMVLQYAAAIKKKFGEGEIYLFGPHFEHPRYPDANRIIVEILEAAPTKGGFRPAPAHRGQDKCSLAMGKLLMAVKSEVSNARIVAIALQRYALSWPIGIKVYEPPKVLHFLETIWSRIPSLLKVPREHDARYLDDVLEQVKKIKNILRAIKARADDQVDTLPLAVPMIPALKQVTARFLDYHFRGKLAAG